MREQNINKIVSKCTNDLSVYFCVCLNECVCVGCRLGWKLKMNKPLNKFDESVVRGLLIYGMDVIFCQAFLMNF